MVGRPTETRGDTALLAVCGEDLVEEVREKVGQMNWFVDESGAHPPSSFAGCEEVTVLLLGREESCPGSVTFLLFFVILLCVWAVCVWVSRATSPTPVRWPAVDAAVDLLGLCCCESTAIFFADALLSGPGHPGQACNHRGHVSLSRVSVCRSAALSPSRAPLLAGFDAPPPRCSCNKLQTTCGCMGMLSCIRE